MTYLDDYEELWRDIAGELEDEITVMIVTATEEMGKEIRQLPDGAKVLFLLPPATAVKASDVDWRDTDQCLVFLLRKYQPARIRAVDVLRDTQRDIDTLKQGLLDRWLDSGCNLSTVIPGTIDIQPETGLFGVFAGWSLAYKCEG